MNPLVLELPFPPSVNNYWRNAGRTLLSQQARIFRRTAKVEIEAQLWRLPYRHEVIAVPVSCAITLHKPDKRKRDLDNMIKAVLDVLTHAGVWTDDSLVHELHLAWGEICEGGKARVEICKWTP